MYKQIKVYSLICLVFFISLCTDDSKDSKTELNSKLIPSVMEDKEAISTAFGLQEVLGDIARKVLPAVVDLRVEKRAVAKKGGLPNFFRFFDRNPFFKRDGEPTRQISIGSGFVISKSGYIITNAHLIESADDINVLLESEEYKAKLVGKDIISDIAVISVDKIEGPIKYLKIEETDFEVGDFVVAVGNPFGLSGTFTFGVVSAKARVSPQVDRNAMFKHFIQTDASINRGNSGGPLLNIKGEVIGINTAIYAGMGGRGGSVGIGFAVPVRIAAPIAKALIADGNVDRGYIGVSIKDLDKELAGFFEVDKGAIVLALEKGGPAYNAGIRKGDIIIKVNEKELRNSAELVATISSITPKTRVIITLLRNKKKLKLPVILKKRPTNPVISLDSKKEIRKEGYKTDPNRREWLGLIFENLKEGQLKENSGLVIVDIKRASAAYEASTPLRKGDILESINSYQLHKLKDLDGIIKKLKSEGSFLLWLKRGQREFYSVVKKK